MLFALFFNDTATTEIYTLSLHDALPISDAGVADVVDVVAGALRVRSVLSVTGDRAIHQTRVHGGERIVADAQLRHGAGTESLDEDIGAFCKAQKDFPSLRSLQVEADGALVAVDQPEEIRHALPCAAHLAGVVAGACVLDLDDVRTQIGEVQRRHRARKQTRQIEDADSGEGFAALRHLCRPAVSVVLLRILDHLAVVRQLAELSERNFAAQLGDTADAVLYRLRESCRRHTAHLALQGHAVGSARIVHDKARLQDFLVSPYDLGDLRWLHEHSFHLGGLVGTAHPTANAGVGAPTGALPRQYRRQVSGSEPHQRVIRIEAGDDHFADFAVRHGVARAGAHDLEDQRFVEDHAFERLGLVGDEA